MATLTEKDKLMLMALGNDVDQGIFNDPSYKNDMIQQKNDMIRMNMRTPNSVVNPKTGAYMGEVEQVPMGNMGAGMASNADMNRMTGIDSVGQDPLAGFIESQIKASGNQPVNTQQIMQDFEANQNMDPIDQLLMSLGL